MCGGAYVVVGRGGGGGRDWQSTADGYIPVGVGLVVVGVPTESSTGLRCVVHLWGWG